jgi:hypothetical protein
VSRAGVSFPSYVSDAAFAMITGAAHADYPVANLGVLEKIRTPFKATASGAIAFSCVLSAAQSVEFVALAHHSATNGATYRIRSYSDAAMTTLVDDSGTLSFSISADDQFPAVTPYMLPSVLTVRAVRVDLSSIGVAWQIGGLEVSGFFDLSQHDARSLGIRAKDQRQDVGSGLTHGTRQFSPRTITLGNSLIDWSDIGPTFLDFQMEKGTSQPFVWLRDYTDDGTWQREAVLVRNASLPAMTKNAWIYGELGLDLVEHLR